MDADGFGLSAPIETVVRMEGDFEVAVSVVHLRQRVSDFHVHVELFLDLPSDARADAFAGFPFAAG